MAFLHVGYELKTQVYEGLTSGFEFLTDFGTLTSGSEFRSTYYREITSGYELASSYYDPVIDELFITGLSPSVFTGGSPSVMPGDPYLPPEIVPEVVITSFKLLTGTVAAATTLPGGGVVQNPGLISTSTVELAPYVRTFSMEQNFGGKWSFNATFTQNGTPGAMEELLSTFPSDLNPLFRGRNAFAGVIVKHRFDITRQIIITLRVGKGDRAVTWTSPPFAPLTPHFDGYTLTWSGEDLSVIFEQEYQTLKDITPRDTVLSKAWATMTAIGAKYNFANFNFQFADYTIRKLEMTKSKPIDWLDRIARPYQAFRTWVNGSLQYIAAPDPMQTGASWQYYDYMMEDPGAEVVQNDGWKNSFTLSRLKDNSGLYGEAHCSGGQCIGRTLKIDLTEPVNTVNMKLDIIGPAILHRFTFFNATNQVLGITDRSPTFASAEKITRIEGTFEPTWNQVTAQTTGPFISNNIPYSASYGYDVYVNGGSSVASSVFDAAYTFKLADAVSVDAGFGLLPNYQSIEDEIIPTAALAQIYIKALLLQNIRRIFKLSFTTRYVNPLVTPPSVINISDYLFATQFASGNQNNWVVEKVNLDMDDHGHWTQKFECYRGLPIG